MKQNSLLCYLNSRQVAAWKSKSSKLQPPESTQAGQNSASFWIPLVCLMLCHCSSSLPEQANQQHTYPGSPKQGNHKAAVPEQWKHQDDVTLHQKHWSTVVTRISSEVTLPQEVILVDTTTAPERSSPCFPFLLSTPLCISFVRLAFIWIAIPIRFMIYHVVIKLQCQHKERSGLRQWEVGGLCFFFF